MAGWLLRPPLQARGLKRVVDWFGGVQGGRYIWLCSDEIGFVLRTIMIFVLLVKSR